MRARRHTVPWLLDAAMGIPRPLQFPSLTPTYAHASADEGETTLVTDTQGFPNPLIGRFRFSRSCVWGIPLSCFWHIGNFDGAAYATPPAPVELHSATSLYRPPCRRGSRNSCSEHRAPTPPPPNFAFHRCAIKLARYFEFIIS